MNTPSNWYKIGGRAVTPEEYETYRKIQDAKDEAEKEQEFKEQLKFSRNYSTGLAYILGAVLGLILVWLAGYLIYMSYTLFVTSFGLQNTIIGIILLILILGVFPTIYAFWWRRRLIKQKEKEKVIEGL